jgi:hypothetical protein
MMIQHPDLEEQGLYTIFPVTEWFAQHRSNFWSNLRAQVGTSKGSLGPSLTPRDVKEEKANKILAPTQSHLA